jgi:hypothetical protein
VREETAHRNRTQRLLLGRAFASRLFTDRMPMCTMHSCNHACTNGGVMHNIKTVGKSGQISLGKAMAGMEFIMQQLPGGDIVLKRAVVVPMNEKLLDSAVHAELEAARQWRQNNPAKATDLTALASKLGITSE